MAIDRVVVNEHSNKQISFTILDEDNAVVPDSDILSATLTLYDCDTYVAGSPPEGIINSRDQQNVFNTNNVSMTSLGVVTWVMQPDDNVIVTRRRQIERHRAEFHFTWATGEFWYRCEIEVRNMGRPA